MVPTEETCLDKVAIFRQNKRSVQDADVILLLVAAKEVGKTITFIRSLLLNVSNTVEFF